MPKQDKDNATGGIIDGGRSGIPASSWGGDNYSGREKHRQKNTQIYKHNGYGNVGVYRQNYDSSRLR